MGADLKGNTTMSDETDSYEKLQADGKKGAELFSKAGDEVTDLLDIVTLFQFFASTKTLNPREREALDRLRTRAEIAIGWRHEYNARIKKLEGAVQ
jgi:hypothetical protein